MTFRPMQLPNPQIISLFLRGSGMSSYAAAVSGNTLQLVWVCRKGLIPLPTTDPH